MKYVHTPDMGEISGFGGGYEATCQAMLTAGVEWTLAHPDAAPAFQGYRGVTGVIHEENGAAKQLSKAVTDAAGEYGATGAMHQAVIQRVLVIKQHGWDWYCEECRKHEANRVNESA